MSTLPLRAALTRGALVTAANWQVVLVDFVVESFYKLALAVPVVGGAVMVAAIVGADLRLVVAEGLRATADLVIGSLATAPVALTAFLAAIGVVAFGGGIILFAIKAGTLAVLVAGERGADDLHGKPLEIDAFRRAAAFNLAAVYAATKRFARRASALALGLAAGYFTIGLTYLVAMSYSFTLAVRSTWTPAWPVVVLLGTSAAVVTIGAVNLSYDLLRVIVVTDDCGVREAVRRLRRFVVEDARQVIGIFCVMGGVVIFATAASVLAAAGLTIVPWAPFAGVIMLPLQAIGWVIRGLVFQFMALAALAAYQTQYRRLSRMA